MVARITLPDNPVIVSMGFTNPKIGCSSSLAKVAYTGKGTFEAVQLP